MTMAVIRTRNKEQRKKRACLLRYCVCYPVSLSLNTVFDDEDNDNDDDDDDDHNDDDYNDDDNERMMIIVNSDDSDILYMMIERKRISKW